MQQCDFCEYWGKLITCGAYDLCPTCAEKYEEEKLDAEYEREEEEE